MKDQSMATTTASTVTKRQNSDQWADRAQATAQHADDRPSRWAPWQQQQRSCPNELFHHRNFVGRAQAAAAMTRMMPA